MKVWCGLLLTLFVAPSSVQACRVTGAQFGDSTHWICEQCDSAIDCCRSLPSSRPCAATAVPTRTKTFSWFEQPPPGENSPTREKDPVFWKEYSRGGNSAKSKEGPTTSMFDRLGPQQQQQQQQPTITPSSLSQEGGMHRILSQNIQVSSSHGNATLLVYLTEHVFVDVEHVLGKDCTAPTNHDESLLLGSLPSCRVNRIVADMIDTEKPSFLGSQQHVVALELEWQNVATTSMTMELEIVLHLRYPTPRPGGGFVESLLPAPTLVQAMAETAQPPHRFTIAVGNTHDFIFVGTMTLLAHVTGAIVLARFVADSFAPRHNNGAGKRTKNFAAI